MEALPKSAVLRYPCHSDDHGECIPAHTLLKLKDLYSSTEDYYNKFLFDVGNAQKDEMEIAAEMLKFAINMGLLKESRCSGRPFVDLLKEEMRGVAYCPAIPILEKNFGDECSECIDPISEDQCIDDAHENFHKKFADKGYELYYVPYTSQCEIRQWWSFD